MQGRDSQVPSSQVTVLAEVKSAEARSCSPFSHTPDPDRKLNSVMSVEGRCCQKQLAREPMMLVLVCDLTS